MGSILTNKLPVDIKINEVLYKINSDYRTSIIFANYIQEHEELTEKDIIYILNLYYPVIPEDIEQAINYIFWFYRCGEDEKEGNSTSTGNNKRIFDYEADGQYIYSAFLSQYRIDLQEINYLHWWKFKALFESLSEDNEIIKIMQYRAMDLSKIKDKEQKKFYKKMKDIYKLKEKISKEDKDALDKVRDMLKKQQKGGSRKMADGSIIIDTRLNTTGLENGLSSLSGIASKGLGAITTATKIMATGIAAATGAVVALTKASVEQYAEYEQLTGGVETLFKDSADQVMQYANVAYKTAGLSANEYMNTITGFSASLLQGLGGDTKKAAEIGNMAVIDMSDNANKMG